MADNLKLTAAALIVLLGVVGFYYFSDKSDLLRWGLMLLSLGIAVAVAYQTATGKRFAEYAKAARQELRKVVWPTNRETMQVTLVVVALVVVVALFLWVVDWGLQKAVRLVMGQGA
jgi:preprotein translocase subunit SecE